MLIITLVKTCVLQLCQLCWGSHCSLYTVYVHTVNDKLRKPVWVVGVWLDLWVTNYGHQSGLWGCG